MLTKNWEIADRLRSFYYYPSFNFVNGKTVYKFTSYAGHEVYPTDIVGLTQNYAPMLDLRTNSVQISSNESYSNYVGVWLGSGTTVPTKNDYKLENHIKSGLTPTSITYSASFDNDDPEKPITIKRTFGVTNISGSPITVAEIGLTCWFGNARNVSNDAYASDSDKVILMDRTLLDSPITIPAGASATINYFVSLP